MPHKDPEVRRAYGQAYNKRYSQENRETINLKSKDYYYATPEKQKARKKAYRLAHLEEIREKNRLYHLANLDKSRANTRLYQKRHPDRICAKTKARRARKYNAPLNDLSHAQWLEIQASQNHRCYYCGKRCKGKLTQDHITPLAKGGSHTLANVIGACQLCNSKKWTGPPLKAVQPLLLSIAKPRKKKAF